jgi:hypothetical protein
VSTLQAAETAVSTKPVDVDQQLLIEMAGGDSLADAPLPEGPLPDVPLPDGCIPESCLDCVLGEVRTSSRIAEEAMGDGFGLVSGSCLVHFLCSDQCILCIDYDTCREIFGLLRVYFISAFYFGFIILVVFYS